MKLKQAWKRFWRKPSVEEYLVVISELGTNAYGNSIRRNIGRKIGKNISFARLRGFYWLMTTPYSQ